MSIVLLILKIIGITILSVLGLIMAILLLVLFVPVRYKLSGDKPVDGDIKAEIKITWLLHFVNVKVTYLSELFYRARIMIFTLVKSENLKTDRDRKREQKKEERKRRKAEKQKQKAKRHKDKTDRNSDTGINSTTEVSLDQNTEIDSLSANDFKEADFKDADFKDVIIDSDFEDSNYDPVESESDKELEKQSFFEKLLFILEKIIDFIFDFSDKISAATQKVSDIIENIDYYIDAVNDERNKNAVNLCKHHLASILKNIKPTKLKGYIHIGSDDPYKMGKMMSIYGILFPLIHDKIQVVPDYDNEAMDGNLMIKGRITVAVVIWALFKVYFNKDFKHMLKVFKKK